VLQGIEECLVELCLILGKRVINFFDHIDLQLLKLVLNFYTLSLQVINLTGEFLELVCKPTHEFSFQLPKTVLRGLFKNDLVEALDYFNLIAARNCHFDIVFFHFFHQSLHFFLELFVLFVGRK